MEPLFSPRKFWGGGSRAPAEETEVGAGAAVSEAIPPWPPKLLDPPWPPKLPDPPWPPESLDPPWPPESLDPPWPPESLDPPWPPESLDSPWPPELPAPPWPPELPAPPWPPELPAPPWVPERAPPWRPPVLSCLRVPWGLQSAHPPPPRWMVYGAGRTVREGGVLSDLCSPCHVFPLLSCPYLVSSCSCPHLLLSVPSPVSLVN